MKPLEPSRRFYPAVGKLCPIPKRDDVGGPDISIVAATATCLLAVASTAAMTGAQSDHKGASAPIAYIEAAAHSHLLHP